MVNDRKNKKTRRIMKIDIPLHIEMKHPPDLMINCVFDNFAMMTVENDKEKC